VERERRGAYEHAKSELRSPRYTRAIISLSRWLEAHQWRNQPVDEKSARLAEPISEIAPDLLDRQYRQAKKRGRKLRQAGALQRHRLRIALKKLRYTIDFLCSLFDEAEVDRFSRRLKQLQSELGDSNDVRVAHELLAKLDHGDQPTEISLAAGFVLGWQSERIAGRDDLLQDQFRKFKRLGAFW